MKEYKMLRTLSGWGEFFLALLVMSFSLVFCFFAGFNLISILVSVFFIRIAFYSLIDFLLVKTIVETDGKLFIKAPFLKWELDRTRCYTAIELAPLENSNPVNSLGFQNINKGFKDYCLVLTRNEKRWWNRLFKNKIRLYAQDGSIDLEGVAHKISDMFGIIYRGIDKSWDGGSYSDDNADLQKFYNRYVP